MTTTLIPVLGAIVAAIVAVACTPVLLRAARAIGAIDAPDERRVHTVSTPRLGGLAILAGFLVPALFFLPEDGPTRALVFGAIAIALLGAIDDIWGLNPAAKLLGQIACAAVPVSAGLTIDHVTLPFLGVYDLGVAQYPLSVLWIVALVNMINFTDGVDGLAAGMAMISAGTFAVLAASLDRAEPAILSAALAGACLGFLYYNFNPARIFMGDSGSMLLGYVLAGVAISGVMKSAAAIALIAPLIILAIPILDTSFVVMKRIKHGLPVYAADRSHFHHRFLNIGWSQRRTVLAVYGWCLLMGLIAVAIRFVPYTNSTGDYQLAGALALLGLGAVALFAAVYLIYVLEILKWGRTPVVQIVRERSLARARAKAGDAA